MCLVRASKSRWRQGYAGTSSSTRTNETTIVRLVNAASTPGKGESKSARAAYLTAWEFHWRRNASNQIFYDNRGALLRLRCFGRVLVARVERSATTNRPNSGTVTNRFARLNRIHRLGYLRICSGTISGNFPNRVAHAAKRRYLINRCVIITYRGAIIAARTENAAREREETKGGRQRPETEESGVTSHRVDSFRSFG